MTVPVGGKRDRLIAENFTDMLESALTSLGWLSDANELAELPVVIMDEPAPTTTEVKPNRISVTVEDTLSEAWEMGSNLEAVRWNYYVEIFAENDSVGKHLSGDIRDILKGKMPSIGRTGPYFTVYDVELATPVALFECGLDEIESQRTHSFDSSIRQHWWTVACIVEDFYGNEDDA